MNSKLYVGNLSYQVNSQLLSECFSSHGTVQSAEVVMDRDTGRSKGFGFVEMSTAEEAEAAMAQLDGTEIEGRSIKVNEARPRQDRPRTNGQRPRW